MTNINLMSERIKIIYISIFYNRQQWQKLVTRLYDISLSFKTFKNYPIFIVHFSHNLKEKIGVSIIAPEQFAKDIIQIFHTDINIFLKKSPSKPIRNKVASNTRLFKDMSTNTLHYNLHTFPKIYRSVLTDEEQILLSSAVSSILLEELRHGRINEDTIYTISFYLHGILLRALFSTIQSCEQYLSNFLLKNSIEGKKEEILYNNLRSNSSLFLEIINDIFMIDFSNETRAECWTNWEQECRSIIKSNNSTSHPVYLIAIAKLIDKQLGINICSYKIWFKIIAESLSKK